MLTCPRITDKMKQSGALTRAKDEQKDQYWREVVQETSHSSLMPSGTYFSRLCDNDRPGITTATRQRQEELGIHEDTGESRSWSIPILQEQRRARIFVGGRQHGSGMSRNGVSPDPAPHTPSIYRRDNVVIALSRLGMYALDAHGAECGPPKRRHRHRFEYRGPPKACPAKRDQFERFERGPV
ncbi:hypothetical protein ARMGADRAFT_1066495 [Armillaria gallica]|uniref:Uncharacterized protein n=1 Tax=Armillaria gallica TaxID=47427 RepID=A0A2H3CYM1_ARMGA|nr:hypothetical protein ARMGADRAFT_1066495 [Armillaria gallica]